MYAMLNSGQAVVGPRILSMEDVIRLAQENFISAMTNRNIFAASYWQYRSFKAQYLPSLNLNGNLANFNRKMPLGFHVGADNGYWWDSYEKRQQALLLFIVAIIIYMICATMFESLRKPLSIIVMIPLGLIGLFLTFPIFGVTFDQGGYAAMVMLCGIVVNASIYLISEYNTVNPIALHRSACHGETEHSLLGEGIQPQDNPHPAHHHINSAGSNPVPVRRQGGQLLLVRLRHRRDRRNDFLHHRPGVLYASVRTAQKT